MALMLDARRLIPPNARVATLRPRARHQDNLLFMAASGQLPRHLVVGADALVSDQPPDFVIALEARFDDPRFDLMHETPGGGIWRRIR